MAALFLTGTAWASSPDDAETDNPYSQFDPNGVPLNVVQPARQKYRISDEQIEAMRKQNAQEALDRNWLLLEYEKQLRDRTGGDADKEKHNNLYLQLSMDKDLSKLAGLQTIEPDAAKPNVTFHAASSTSEKNAPTLRPEVATSFFTPGAAFKPLITPLNSAGPNTSQSFSSTLPLSMAPPFSGAAPTGNPAPAPRPTVSADPVDLQTPGMVAARQDPMADVGTPDLSLDVLPGETAQQAHQRQSGDRADLPVPMDASQLHKAQAATNKAPGFVGQVKAAPPEAQPVKAIPVNPEDAPTPVNEGPQISPVHAPIANPYDILNR